MKFINFLSLGVVIIMFHACSTRSVFSDYDENASFNNYKTYAIAKNPENLSTKVNPINLHRIEKAILTELRNLHFVASDEPDMIVEYYVQLEEVEDVSTHTSYYGRWWRFPVTEVTVDEYEKGAIVINLIDANTERVVWHGVISGRVTYNRKKIDQNIQEAVKAIFDEYAAQMIQVNS